MKASVAIFRLGSAAIALSCASAALAQKDNNAKPPTPPKTDQVTVETTTGRVELKSSQGDGKNGRQETFVFVRPPMPRMSRDHAPMIFIKDEQLGLTLAQQKKFDQVCREFIGKIHEVIANPSVPREQKGEKIKPLQAKFKETLLQILTPVQRAEVDKREKAMAEGNFKFREHPFGAMRVMMRRMPPPPGSRDHGGPPPPPPHDPKFE